MCMRQMLYRCRYAKHDAEMTIVVAGAADAEVSYLARMLHVSSEAGTYVVVAHIDKTQRVAGIGGQLAQVNAGRHFISRHVARGHGKVCLDDAVYLGFDLAHLFFGRARGELVVALALLPLYMVYAGA